jgi:biofilm PGA synthesis N-glycosyltransferase PgaC
MAIFQDLITYFFLFLTIYVEIILLTTYVVKRSEIHEHGNNDVAVLTRYPTVTIVVPCFNEEKTVRGTLESLAAIDYPKDKLKIIVVNDGSTDGTQQEIESFKKSLTDTSQIEIVNKENGGKFTALNVGIEKSKKIFNGEDSEFIGCLDSDSFVEPKTLKKIIYQFLLDADVMAITPALRISNPNTLPRLIQSAEYHLGVLSKRVQAYLGAIHVTPGPFTIFRKEVFEKIGVFKHSHNLEDMEMAFRMQANFLKIGNVHNAWVYTVGPDSFKKLYRQRLRWTHGFIENAKDYRYMFFNPKYGNVALYTLPSSFLFLIAVIFTVFFVFVRLISFIIKKYIEIKTVGFVFPQIHVGWFYISTNLTVILSAIVFLLTLSLLMNAQKLVEGKARPGIRIILFFLIYPLVSPFWVLKSMYNSIFRKTTTWR